MSAGAPRLWVLAIATGSQGAADAMLGTTPRHRTSALADSLVWGTDTVGVIGRYGRQLMAVGHDSSGPLSEVPAPLGLPPLACPTMSAVGRPAASLPGVAARTCHACLPSDVLPIRPVCGNTRRCSPVIVIVAVTVVLYCHSVTGFDHFEWRRR